MSQSRDPVLLYQGCLKPALHGRALPLPFLLFPVLYLMPHPRFVTAGDPWASLRFVLSLNLPHSPFLPGFDNAFTSMARIQFQSEGTQKYDSPLPGLPIPCYNVTLWNASHTV